MSKYMKMKKILCAGCATVMAMSCFAGAAEAITDVSSAVEFAFTTKVQTGTIKLTMNKTGDLYINPYGIDVPVTAAATSQEKIISPTQFIKNQSNTGLKVFITPTIKPSANVTLKSSLTNEDKGKAATMGFDIISNDDDATEPADWTSANRVDLGDYETVNGQLKNTGFVLGRGDLNASGDPTTTEADQKPTYAAFRLQGTANDAPVNDEGTDTPWTSDDTIEASLAFTFIPSNGGGNTGVDPADQITCPTAVQLSVGRNGGLDDRKNFAIGDFTFGANLTQGDWTLTSITVADTSKAIWDSTNNRFEAKAAGNTTATAVLTKTADSTTQNVTINISVVA